MSASSASDLLESFRAVDALLDQIEASPGAGAEMPPPRLQSEASISQDSLAGLDDFVSTLRREALEGRVRPRAMSTLGDLLGLHDARFVQGAYLTILQRPVDPQGLAHYVDALRSGSLSKVEVAGRLRWSAEGRAVAVPLPGLLVRYAAKALGRVPVIGYVFRWSVVVARLPEWSARMQRIESHAVLAAETAKDGGTEHIQQLSEATRALAATIIGQSNHAFEALEVRQRAAATAVDFELFRKQVVDADVRRELALKDRLTALVREQERLGVETIALSGHLHDFRSEQLRRLDALTVDMRKVQQSLAWLDRFQSSSLDLSDYPGFYSRFEDRFRGTRDDVLERLEELYPQIAATRALADAGHAIDLGSGRGEWLEIMNRNGFPAVGIDLNDDFLDDLRARGLRCEKADALAYLQSLPANSAPLITAFHLVEHLSIPQVLTLLDECARVLCPYGQILFETPNPENVTVGANHFWYDYTHVRPLAPDLLSFLLEDRGFSNIQNIRLRRNRIGPELGYVDTTFAYNHQLNSLIEVANRSLLSAPDHAITGQKLPRA